TGASFEDRCKMVELACHGDPRLVVSRIEAGTGMSYSIDTIERLRAAGKHPSFIIGADAFAEITTWHRWQDLVSLTDFIVVTRPGHRYDSPPGAHVERLDTLALPVSSSEIRRRLATGEMPPDLPLSVARFISEKGLYSFPRNSMGSVSQP